MTKREQVIITLLERYAELVDPMQVRDGTGDGTDVNLMPRTYTPTVRELERLLIRMRTERRSQWWHVTERYLRCQHKTMDVHVKRKAKNGKTVKVLERQVVTTWHPGVKNERVRRGIEWLADQWSLPTEPMIPRELLVAA